MGDDQGQGGLGPAAPLVLFLDENHCRNPYLISALETHGVHFERHVDHFAPGTEDIVWLPKIGELGWALLTTDAKIRYNFLEREAVRQNRVRMFYFTTNNLGGREMGIALARSLPAILALAVNQPAPFTASISKSGDLRLRDTFENL